MKNLQKIGGFAALYLALAYTTGIIIFLLVLDYPNIVDPAQKIALLIDKQIMLYSTNIFMYVVFGVFLVIMSLAIYERLRVDSPIIVQIAAAIGIIWAGSLIASGMVSNAGIAAAAVVYEKDPAHAISIWVGVESVANGLSGANGEFLGGFFTLLTSLAAFKSNKLPKILNFLGMAIGMIGIISTVPGLADLTGIFGMSQILWFVWLGIILLRGKVETV